MSPPAPAPTLNWALPEEFVSIRAIRASRVLDVTVRTSRVTGLVTLLLRFTQQRSLGKNEAVTL
jgi:hypothetical protein